jgi:hypothetical protein
MMPVDSAPSAARSRWIVPVRRGLVIGAVAGLAVVSLDSVTGGLPLRSVMTTSSSSPASQAAVRHADFGHESPSPDARHLADWIANSRDNAHADFIIVDKPHARAYVFGADARMRGASPVLLGSAQGDDSVPGIGLRPVEEVHPAERTTPAGRFVAELGRNSKGEDVVWVDYDAAVSMHRVRVTDPGERRLERLATPTIDDNRISYGCINVPVEFYETHIRPTFAEQRAIVYVLPDVKSVQQVFGSYDVAATRRQASNRAPHNALSMR